MRVTHVLHGIAVLSLPVLVAASLPFATASCAIFETIRPSITAAGHELINGLTTLLIQLENPQLGRRARQQLIDDAIVALGICAETIPPRYLEPYRRRFHAAVRIPSVSEGASAAPPG